MSKFTETEFGGTKEILKFPDHYVALAVMVSDVGVAAQPEDGKKIVPKGTIVGGSSGSVLANLNQAVANKYVPIVRASKIIGDPDDDNAILFTAVTPGTAGNSVTVTLAVSGNETPLGVTVVGSAITVAVKTGGDGAPVSTAAEVVKAVNDSEAASALVVADASINPDGEGAGVVAAASATNLAGGAAASVSGAEGVLKNDIDVTYGPKEGAMILHGFVKLDALPYGADNALIPATIAADAAAARAFSAIKLIK